MQIWKPLSKKSKRRPSSSALHRHRRPRHSPSHLPSGALGGAADPPVPRPTPSSPRRAAPPSPSYHMYKCHRYSLPSRAPRDPRHVGHSLVSAAFSPRPTCPHRDPLPRPPPSVIRFPSVRPPPGAPESVTRFISILEVFYIDAAPSVIPTYLCNPFCPSVFPSSRHQCQVTSGALSSPLPVTFLPFPLSVVNSLCR